MKRKKTAPKRPPHPPKPLAYAMKLYVTGATPRSTQAVSNLRRLCDQYLPGRYKLEVIDIYQQPALAREGQVIAAPTLVRTLPSPLRRFIGDMSNVTHLLAGLDIKPGGPDPNAAKTGGGA
ncbi:MAG TPA: circadian clock KaiB family protein [Patescibacteria group bacterium]|nr:circadian clock KaiB family protein [Patescibacteria group bacterium]